MTKDPYANEPTVELDPGLWSEYEKAKTARQAWEKEEKRLERLLEATMGDAWAGTIGGKKVVTNRPSDRYAEARLCKEHPDLTQVYMHQELREVFDVNLFSKTHPEILEQYRVRQFKLVKQ